MRTASLRRPQATDCMQDPMTTKSVADFLAARGVGRRKRGSILDAVESEVRELAAAGASINDMLEYLWLNHQMKRARSGFAAWLQRRGIGSSGRQVAPPSPRHSVASTAVRAASPARASGGGEPGQVAQASFALGRPNRVFEAAQPRDQQPPKPADDGVVDHTQRLKREADKQDARINQHRMSTLPAAQEYAHLLEQDAQRAREAQEAKASVDPIDNLERKR
jgi:hypothetical protein